jgi:peroxiredoxin
MRVLAPSFVLLLLVSAAAACGEDAGGGGATSPSGTGAGGAAASGTRAPDFTARDVDGKTFRLSDHLGKEVVLLDFWSTYCEPCKAEFPHLRALYDDDKAKGLLVVGVAMDGPETSADVPSFVKKYGIDFPVVLDEDSRIASDYNPKKSMPLSVIIDRAGSIAVVREGYNPGDEKLVTADVEKALGAAAAAPAPASQ